MIFFVYFKLSSMLLGIHDPFLPFENLFCALFLGGVWDTLSKILAGESRLCVSCLSRSLPPAAKKEDKDNPKIDLTRASEATKKKD